MNKPARSSNTKPFSDPNSMLSWIVYKQIIHIIWKVKQWLINSCIMTHMQQVMSKEYDEILF